MAVVHLQNSHAIAAAAKKMKKKHLEVFKIAKELEARLEWA